MVTVSSHELKSRHCRPWQGVECLLKMTETTGSMDMEKKTNNNFSYREKGNVRVGSITPSLILETILLHGTSLLKYMIKDCNLTSYHMFRRKS